ncbi:MAG: glycosyltransferase [Ruminococcus sp.]|jgi:glycosyltransferase involved in cell wall biosynthesis|nr:glycosyltransferase [Ruminococcus sp.]
MILSIGMIVKDEISHIEDCLKALKPLTESADSELIIADTGSNDGTDKIAEQYADIFIRIPWEDDFGAARNEVLKRSSGEWFMFIDADEILENPEQIIRFYSSGEYKNYNSATYIQRNLFTAQGAGYSDFRPARMTKISPETSFKGIVHEALTTFGEPIKNLDAIVLHYGYISDNDNLKIKARERVRQLQKKSESDRENGDLNALALDFNEISEAALVYDKNLAEDYDKKGFALADEPAVYPYTKMVFTAKLSKYAYERGEYDKAYSLGLIRAKALGSDGEVPAMANDIDIFTVMGFCAYKHKNTEAAVAALSTAAALIAELQNGELFSADYYFHKPSFANKKSVNEIRDIITKIRMKSRNDPEIYNQCAECIRVIDTIKNLN